MQIRFGTNEIVKMFYGSHPIDGVYLGDLLVWQPNLEYPLRSFEYDYAFADAAFAVGIPFDRFNYTYSFANADFAVGFGDVFDRFDFAYSFADAGFGLGISLDEFGLDYSFSAATFTVGSTGGGTGPTDIQLDNLTITTSDSLVGNLTTTGGVAPITYDVISPAYDSPSFAGVGTHVSSSTTSMAIPLPSGTEVGDALIAATTIVNTRLPVWPADWTPIGDGAIAAKIADGTEGSTVTVTWTGAVTQSGICARYNGPSAGIGNHNDNQAQSGTPATVTGVNATKNGSLMVAVIVSGVAQAPATPIGFTSDYSDTLTAIRLASVLKNAGESSGDVSSAVNSSGVWRAAIIELKKTGL